MQTRNKTLWHFVAVSHLKCRYVLLTDALQEKFGLLIAPHVSVVVISHVFAHWDIRRGRKRLLLRLHFWGVETYEYLLSLSIFSVYLTPLFPSLLRINIMAKKHLKRVKNVLAKLRIFFFSFLILLFPLAIYIRRWTFQMKCYPIF